MLRTPPNFDASQNGPANWDGAAAGTRSNTQGQFQGGREHTHPPAQHKGQAESAMREERLARRITTSNRGGQRRSPNTIPRKRGMMQQSGKPTGSSITGGAHSLFLDVKAWRFEVFSNVRRVFELHPGRQRTRASSCRLPGQFSADAKPSFKTREFCVHRQG